MSRPALRIPAPFVPFVGKVPDTALAERLGCSNAAVGNYRRRKGIPAFNGVTYDADALAAAGRPVVRPSATPAPAAANPLLSGLTSAPPAPAASVSEPEKETVHPAIRKALTSARPVSGGMLISYSLFAEAIEAAKV